MPLPQLLYAQGITGTRRRRLVRVRHRVVFGALAAIEKVLAVHDWHINTAFTERVNLTIRQHVAAVGRCVMTLGKGEGGLRQQLALSHAECVPCRSPSEEGSSMAGRVVKGQSETRPALRTVG